MANWTNIKRGIAIHATTLIGATLMLSFMESMEFYNVWEKIFSIYIMLLVYNIVIGSVLIYKN